MTTSTGSLLLPDEVEKLVGGYARVYRKDREKSFYMAVNKAECLKYTRNGNLTKFWVKDKQPMMLRKTALKRALVEAFPSLFAGTMFTAEVADETEAEYREMPEGELPPAMEKEGKPDWKKLWARVKSEPGLTTKEAHQLLQVGSIKEELINQGWTPEQVWGALINALQQKKATEGKPEQIVNTTGEVIAQEENLFSKEDIGAAASSETEKHERQAKGKEQTDPVERQQPSDAAAPTKPKRDPESIKTINELLKACHDDWGMQPKAVYAELNAKSASEITELPSECYRRIQAVKD